MPFFSSKRERRLWLWSLAVVLAIYATLGLTGTLAVALGVAAAYLMVFTRVAILEERTHLIEFGVLGVFIHEALTERASQGRRVPIPPVLAVLATAALGVIDEGIQWLLPNRVFDPQDILFNLLAGTMAVSAVVSLAWARRRTSRRSR